MKVNKPKSPYIGGADAPGEKDVAKAIKGEKFAETLSALASGPTENAELNSTRELLAQIALNSDLSNDAGTSAALSQSAQILVKSRLGQNLRNSPKSEQMIRELSEFVSDDPFLKTKLLSVLRRLNEGGR